MRGGIKTSPPWKATPLPMSSEERFCESTSAALPFGSSNMYNIQGIDVSILHLQSVLFECCERALPVQSDQVIAAMYACQPSSEFP